jgi:quercetin dioxygenase-like cupin family protein
MKSTVSTKGAQMTATARPIRPDEGARFEMPDGAHIARASAEETGGAFEVFEVEAPAAPSAPLHRSPWTGTMFVLEGSLRVRFEDGEVDLTAGSSITIPGQTAFTFDVLGESARFLAVTSGDRAGRFFADFAASVPTRRPFEEVFSQVAAVTSRHGVSVVEPVAGPSTAP